MPRVPLWGDGAVTPALGAHNPIGRSTLRFVPSLSVAPPAALLGPTATALAPRSGGRRALLAELTTAGADGRSMKHMLKKITKALVHSDHVEEIYASDDEIKDLLKKQLGG